MTKTLWVLLLVLCTTTICALYPYFEFLNIRFEGWHIWRQADCLSITKCYNWFDNSVFEPRLLNLGYSGNGRTGSDFPLIYFLIAKCSSVSNIEFNYKVTATIISLTGLISFFLLVRNFVSNLAALLSTLFFLASPTYIFYSNNYLMNVPSLSITILGIALLFSYYKKSQIVYFWLGLVCCLVGVLLKVTALVHLIVIVIFLATNCTIKRKLTQFDKNMFFGFLIIVSVITLWIIYISSYNQQNNSGMFLTGILPIWDINDLDALVKISKEMFFRKRTLYLPYIMFSVILLLVLSIVKSGSLKEFLNGPGYIVSIYLFGFIAYLLLFYQVLDQHDYYYINWLIIIPISILGIFFYAKDLKPLKNIVLTSAILLVLVDGIFTCELRLSERYQGWRNEYYREYISKLEADYKNYYSGVLSINSKVFIPSDPTISASLVTLGTQGWSGYNKIDSNQIEILTRNNLEYIVIMKNETIPTHYKSLINTEKAPIIGTYSTLHICN